MGTVLTFDYAMFSLGFSVAVASALLGLVIGAPIRALFQILT